MEEYNFNQTNKPLLVVNNLKDQRIVDEEELRVLKWNFTTPTEELVEQLKNQMVTANVNKLLIANMFHADYRHHLIAIVMLIRDIGDNKAALISNLDLILKWLSLRFFDTNRNVLLKSLQYLDIVFTMLIESEHLLLENEGSSFIPYLILKIGDPNVQIRIAVKNLLKQIAHIYPVSKLFSNILKNLETNNGVERTQRIKLLIFLNKNFGESMVFDVKSGEEQDIARPPVLTPPPPTPPPPPPTPSTAPKGGKGSTSAGYSRARKYLPKRDRGTGTKDANIISKSPKCIRIKIRSKISSNRNQITKWPKKISINRSFLF